MLPIYNYWAAIEEEENLRRELAVQNRVLRDDSNPFELPELHFRRLFRLSKELAHDLIQEITLFMNPGSRSTRIPITLRVLTALRFFATGNYQRGTGEEHLSSMSQQSVSNCINEVANAIEQLSPRYIKFPTDDFEKQQIKATFMENFGFPGIVGVIDGTHVALLQPTEDEHIYFNRKGYHSKNCQIICDSDLVILSVNASFGGASHDSFIWNQSAAFAHMKQNYLAGERNTWLIGDSGYPQQPWLMTPVRNAPENSPEARYNVAHKLARNCVERCIGTLKIRFRCLLKERVLRYDPFKTGIIVNACCVLHNMCMRRHVPLEDEIPENEDNENDLIDNNIDINAVVEGGRVRANIINMYFV